MTAIWELLEKLEVTGKWNFFLDLVNSGKSQAEVQQFRKFRIV